MSSHLAGCQSLVKIVQTFSEKSKTNIAAIEWAAGEFQCRDPSDNSNPPSLDFTNRCIAILESDEATNASKHKKATSYYAAALSLNPTTFGALLKKWPKAKLVAHGKKP